MTTPILEIPEIASSQTNQYVTANEAFRALESAMRASLDIDFAAGDIDLTVEQLCSAFLFRSSGNTVARVFTIPEKSAFFAVQNLGSETLTVKRGAAEIPLAASSMSMFYSDGSADGLFIFG